MKLLRTNEYTFCANDINAMKLLTFFRINRTSDDGRNLIFNDEVSHNWDALPAALIKMVKDGVIESFAEEKDAYRISVLTKSIEDIW